jgi:predicted O-methyltransferase YrrM
MSATKTIFGRLTGSLVRRLGRHATELSWRDPGLALRAELQRRATVAAADFVAQNMQEALFCPDKFTNLSYAFQQSPGGLNLEFGVFKGTTINYLASAWPNKQFFGFDSFVGLPEHWKGARYSAVNFDRKGRKPVVAPNVTLVEGWFDQTLPAFLAREQGPIGFVHVDCDIYASSKTVLDLVAAKLAPGAIIVFDEFFNYKGYELHEFKAFFEFVQQHEVAYSFIAYSGQQVSVRVDTLRRR